MKLNFWQWLGLIGVVIFGGVYLYRNLTAPETAKPPEPSRAPAKRSTPGPATEPTVAPPNVPAPLPATLPATLPTTLPTAG